MDVKKETEIQHLPNAWHDLERSRAPLQARIDRLAEQIDDAELEQLWSRVHGIDDGGDAAIIRGLEFERDRAQLRLDTILEDMAEIKVRPEEATE